ncbi:histidinol-phosphate transaminase [Nocardia sp. CNY236]|uniref:pyridoxal phosphate-dependent aminotransferase n=1 Tax=Nocardia sp. CNY236 TaxID=1169152 RepID=UPI00040A5CA9|nr:aminotransferase class I/II-fold pyridoxal phosphate-dependent enzyme [Nocardia sp. CNY236]
MDALETVLRAPVGVVWDEYRAGEDRDHSTVRLDLSNNALPFTPLPSVRKAIEAEVDRAAEYPAASYGALRGAIAEFVGCGPDQVIVGPGSVGVLGYILRRVAGAGRRVVYAVPAFDAYERVVVDAGGTPVPLRGSMIRWQTLDRMVAAAGDDAAALLICSPHNPTGEPVRPDEIDRVLSAVPRHTVVVVDEAYIDFDRTADASAVLRLTRAHRNLVVMRTFSKAYGLAGLRVGFAVGDGELIGACRTAAMPFGVNRLAVAAAVASLDVSDELAAQVDEVVRSRTAFLTSIRENGLVVPESCGNFVWVPTRHPASLVDFFTRSAIAVREYPALGVRITVPAPEHTADVVGVLAEGYSRMEASACHR